MAVRQLVRILIAASSCQLWTIHINRWASPPGGTAQRSPLSPFDQGPGSAQAGDACLRFAAGRAAYAADLLLASSRTLSRDCGAQRMSRT
jgi:hypothetical protein